MNQVWVFFKLIEVALGSLCMYFHVKGSLYETEPLPHILIYCATFMSYILIAALGALRLVLTRSTVLSTQLLLTLSAVIMHYICAFLIMRTAIKDPHLAKITNSVQSLAHPHFAHCKQQSIASLLTGTMYLMHMFHVFDLLLRLEPGDWRHQAVGRINSKGMSVVGGRAGLFVLSKPVDNFLCRSSNCYFRLAHSQVLRFQYTAMEEGSTVERMWRFLRNLRRKLFAVVEVESEESFMSTPSITTSDSDEPELEIDEEEGCGKGRRGAKWRHSDSSSLWAQIEDRSTLNRTWSSQSIDDAVRPSLIDRQGRRSPSVWDDTQNKEKSEILLVEQNSRNKGKSLEADEAFKDSRKLGGDSTVRFRADNNAEERYGEGRSSSRTSSSKLNQESTRSETAGETSEDEEYPE